MDEGISDKPAGWVVNIENILTLPGPAEFWP